MSNKREFKKYVEAVGASACETMMSAYYNVESVDKAEVEKAMGMVLGAVGVARANSNVSFDKGPKAFENHAEYAKAKQAFFKKLFAKISEDFMAEFEAALKIFNAAVPQVAKDVNKRVSAE